MLSGVPPVPLNLRLTRVSAGSARFEWSISQFIDSLVFSKLVNNTWEETIVSGRLQFYEDSTLNADTSYQYKVYGQNAYGRSLPVDVMVSTEELGK